MREEQPRPPLAVFDGVIGGAAALEAALDDPPDVRGFAPGDLYRLLGSRPTGLAEAEAALRLKTRGPNQLARVPRRPIALEFLAQLLHLLALLLWAAAALAFIGGLPQLGWAIIAVILINGGFSFWQEYSAERAFEALQRLLPAEATVLREGTERRISATDLVPGDIVVLSEGDRVSADLRLTEAFGLQVEQAALTGESQAVPKTVAGWADGTLEPLEDPSLAFAGTAVVAGTGRGLVYATGMATAFGRIAHLTQGVTAGPSRLQQELARVTRVIAVLATAGGALFFALGLASGLTLLDGFLFAVGLIVANVPEGLLPTLTLALALGVQRMARQNALIRRLIAVESLGSCTVICTDKTGTLTENRMTVTTVWVAGEEWQVNHLGFIAPAGGARPDGPGSGGHPALARLLRAGALANNAHIRNPAASAREWETAGDPTEVALLALAVRTGADLLETLAGAPRLYELPFDATRRRMSVVCREDGMTAAYVKGAPADVVDCSVQLETAAGPVPLTEEVRDSVLAASDRLARQGLRVLAVAWRPNPPPAAGGAYYEAQVERELVLLGLVAMEDPPRPEVRDAVRQARLAGIRVVMITGDHPLTAQSIARAVGLLGPSSGRVMEGTAITALSDAELGGVLRAEDVVFARMNPIQKLRIVELLQAMGERVAVTGDGVNDAPALKRADVGVAMGIAGTDVAKEASDVVLLDDNFATIVAAVEQGRAIYDNIRKFTTYIFASNVPEIVPFLAMVFLGVPLPLTVLQILAVDLGTDMLPALALGAEPPEQGTMERPPRGSREHVVDRALLARAYGFLGIIEAVAAMAGFFWVYWTFGWRPGLVLDGEGAVYRLATTMTLACIVASQVGNAFAVRTERASVFQTGLFSNPRLLAGIAVELVLLAAVSYLPPLQGVFGTEPLRPMDWAFMLPWPLLLLAAEEGRKAIARLPHQPQRPRA